jgi:uncharacterized Zn finger protein
MGNNASSLREVYDVDRIARLSGARAYARAELIPRRKIENLKIGGGRATATVRGTLPYEIALWIEGQAKPGYSCTCPQGADQKFCKHAAAVALALHDREDETRRRGKPELGVDDDPVFEYLLGLEHDELARLVYDAANRDDRTAQRIQSKIAVSVGAAAVDQKEWRKAITAAFGRPSRYIDYYAAPGWAARVHALLQSLADLCADVDAAAVIPLAEYAFERADKATGYVDSSDGWFIGISDEIAQLHYQACLEARPDPVALVRRLVGFDLHAELDTFRRAAATYADILGAEGLAEYRRAVEPAYEALGPKMDEWAAERFHLTEAMLGLAQANNDADEVIRIKSRALRSPHDYEEIVAALTDAGRTDEAIAWAREGIDLDGREHQKRGLREQLVGLLRETGDAPGAADIRLRGFHAAPSLATYQALLAEFGDAGSPERASQREAALDWLRECAIATNSETMGSILVEVLCYEGEVDAAWDAATAVGCTESWWMTLARARERDHPSDAIPVYQRAVADLIGTKKSERYSDAVALMKRVHSLYDAVGEPDGWEAYRHDLVNTHKAKSSLMRKIGDAGLG